MIIFCLFQETGLSCDKVILTLYNVQFENETMPLNWLSRMPTNVRRLCLKGGNLRHIPPTAFLGQFAGGLKTLVLDSITIASWTSDTFVGLSHLNELVIKDSLLMNIGKDALRAIDETIQSVIVTNNGKWNPAFLTGMSSLQRLTDVDFSLNDFGNIINKFSFRALKSCKVLFLNSCKIASIEAGAFDFLENIEILFLNDNFLLTVPSGLFSTILSINNPKPRIHLQDNLWECNCKQKDLISLSKNGLLLIDPICHRPEHMHGKPISILETYCGENDMDPIDIFFRQENFSSKNRNVDSPCYNNRERPITTALRVISPVSRYSCHFLSVNRNQIQPRQPQNNDTNDWIKPTFFMQDRMNSMIQIGSSLEFGYGLIWYHSQCPNEIHCISTMPSFLTVYSELNDTEYTFCPFHLFTDIIETTKCVFTNISQMRSDFDGTPKQYKYLPQLPTYYFAITALFCILFGALFVYGVIRHNPALLKGSKRLLFVKHKNVEALVLPPKIPLRSSLTSESNINDTGVFTVGDGKLYNNNLVRSNSMRSDKSYTPTYVSAMQPTEAQLAEWRIRNHFDKNDSLISISSDYSNYSWIWDRRNEGSTHIPYTSLK